MTKNQILDELHAVREQLLANSGGTLDALVDQLQADEKVATRLQFDSTQRNCDQTSASIATKEKNQTAVCKGASPLNDVEG